MANLREAQSLGLRIKLNSALTMWNEQEIEAMFALADALGVPIQVDPQITRRDDGDPEPLQVAPSAEGVARLFVLQRQRIATLAGSRNPPAEDSGAAAPEPSPGVPDKHCGAGSSTVVVDPYGNVYPCVQWRRHVGNLHDQSIRDLWDHSGALAEVRRQAAEVKETVDRHATPGFSFCPGTAEQETGRATQLYPVAKLLLDLRRRIPVA
jgi:MoaA/NifB/PqqE/SkfB family radical SAM enzyme